MILRPVMPQSAMGPPTTNLPVVFTRYRVSTKRCRRDGLFDDFLDNGLFQIFILDVGLCWAAITTVCTLLGMPLS